LLLILLAHEMGHYLYCRRYGVWATLPFFIPFPFPLFGTLGAFIRIRSPIRSRAALFDIGIGGPIAGFVVALLILVFSLGHSKVGTGTPGYQLIQLQYPLIFHLAHYFRSTFSGSYAIAGAPLSQVYLHPMTVAAWVGMFATALNLLPGGQLDGGHIVFSLAPGAHKFVSRITILALLPLAYYFWVGWLLWAVLLGISAMRHPVVASWPGVSGVRRAAAVFGLIMLILTFTPAPVAHESLPEYVRQIRAR
jgi:membrane-associated protease RseP (regulator of RpoE activity)